MSKFSCIILCAVALSLGGIYAATEEEHCAFRDAIKPFISECSKLHGVTQAEIEKAAATKSTDGIKPCFLACMFKKGGMMNDKGKFDKDITFNKIKMYVKNDDELAKFKRIGDLCEPVNDEAVSDGEEGCDRAVLLMNCIENRKAEMSA